MNFIKKIIRGSPPAYYSEPSYTYYIVEKPSHNTYLYFTQPSCLQLYFLILQASANWDNPSEEVLLMYQRAIDILIENRNEFTKEQWHSYLINFEII